jgi:cysteine desulfurase family protein (TIGR01976 family)
MNDKSNSLASISGIRSHFPALERKFRGHPIAYFDGPGGTQVPRGVVEAMSDYLFNHNANTHWAYPTSFETDELIEEARHALADFFNCDSNEISFGLNMTTITFHIARALGRSLHEADEIVVTELDHHANIAPWQALAKELGVKVRTVRMLSETGSLDWGDLESAINHKTRVIAIGAASNALGTINDVRHVAQLAKEVGALTFIDAVHYAAHGLIDVLDLGCDFLACSAYKFYGPHIGVLFSRYDLMQSLDVPKLIPAPEIGPERLETGTQNHEGITGAAAAVDFLASLGEGETRREKLRNSFATFHSRGKKQILRLWDGLNAINGVTVFGPGPDTPRTPTVSFVVRDIPSIDVSRQLVESGIFTSHGDFYAMTVVERLGMLEQGLVRVGCACYTTDDEIERLLEGVQIISKGID